MKTNNNENLREAARLFEKDFADSYPNELDLRGKTTYSKKHTKRMERMFKRHDSIFYMLTSTTKRSVVTLVMTLLIFSNTLILTNAEARAAIWDFILVTFEEYSDLTFKSTDESPDYLEAMYFPSYIPNGYDVYAENFEDVSLAFVAEFVNENTGEHISFAQTVLTESAWVVDTEDTDNEYLSINGDDGLLIHKAEHDSYSLHWSNGLYQFVLMGNDRDTVLKMAESVSLYDGSLDIKPLDLNSVGSANISYDYNDDGTVTLTVGLTGEFSITLEAILPFKKGDEISITLGKGSGDVGIGLHQAFEPVSSNHIILNENEETIVILTIPEDGEYGIYLENLQTDDISFVVTLDKKFTTLE